MFSQEVHTYHYHYQSNCQELEGTWDVGILKIHVDEVPCSQTIKQVEDSTANYANHEEFIFEESFSIGGSHGEQNGGDQILEDRHFSDTYENVIFGHHDCFILVSRIELVGNHKLTHEHLTCHTYEGCKQSGN